MIFITLYSIFFVSKKIPAVSKFNEGVQKRTTDNFALCQNQSEVSMHFVLPVTRGMNISVPVLRKAGLPTDCSDACGFPSRSPSGMTA